ncbi:MAG: hypothetical protein ACKOYC_00235 [Bacteroidota bacterium]
MKRKIGLSVLACMMLAGPLAATSLNFGEALDRGLVRFEVQPGGDGFRSMGINVQNISPAPIDVTLETGRIFRAIEPNIQPYVVTRPAIITLDPGETEEVQLHARCGNSSAGSAHFGTHFTRTAMGPAPMIATLQDMNRHRVSSNSFYGNIVWHYTNNHDLASVDHSGTDEQVYNAIMRGICERENKNLAQYKKLFKPAPSGDDLEFSGIIANIKSHFNVVLEEPADLKVALLDNNGNTVKVLGYFMQVPEGAFNTPIDFEPVGINAGEYKISLINQDNKTIEQIPVKI